MNRERFEELKEAYALGALPESEKREIEEYLAAHPDLRSEVEELSALSNLLAFAPPEQEPPPALRRSIMSAVEAEAGQRDTGGEGQSTLQRLRSYLSMQQLALGAAAVVLVALLSWNISLLAGDNGLQSYELQGSGATEDVQAEVVEMEEDKFVLLAENVPPMPEDQICQIWVIEDGEPKSAGTFHPEDGLAAAPVTEPLQGAEAIAVTVEPAGGSAQPTSDPVLQTDL